jgi:hypothetical protein
MSPFVEEAPIEYFCRLQRATSTDFMSVLVALYSQLVNKYSLYDTQNNVDRHSNIKLDVSLLIGLNYFKMIFFDGVLL